MFAIGSTYWAIGTAFLLILIGAIELLKALHVSGLLPVLFHVY
jgi:hypothetical protein